MPKLHMQIFHIAEALMNEYLVEGTAHGRPVKVRVFAQNKNAAQREAARQTGDPNMTFRQTTAV